MHTPRARGRYPLGPEVDPLDQRQTPPLDQRLATPGAVHAGTYGQQVGGVHPTGMHSCANFVLAVPLEMNYTNEVCDLEM